MFAGFGLKSGHTPAQLSKARLELGLFDQSLRIAVDQAADRTPCFGQLPGESVQFELARISLKRVEAPLIFLDNQRGVLQQPTNLGPNRFVERLDGNQPSIASAFAVEPAAIGAATAVVAPLSAVVMAGEPYPHVWQTSRPRSRY